MGRCATASVNSVFGSVASADGPSAPVAISRTDTASVAAATANSADTLSGTTTGVRVYVTLTALTGTTPTIAFALWDSADNTTFAAVPGATISAMNATGVASVTLPAGTSVRRFVAVASTVTGTTPSATFTAVVDNDIVVFTAAQNPDHTAVKDTRT